MAIRILSPRSHPVPLCVLLLAFSAVPFAAQATIRHVPEPYPTIQAGIDACAPGDTVLVDIGIYQENILIQDIDITVASYYLTTGDPSYIDDTQVVAAVSRSPVVTIAGGQSRAACLCGFTISGGNAVNGGGVYCYESSPTIDHNKIIDNTADDYGGGIYTRDGSPLIRYCVINNNTSYVNGGGIYAHDSDMLVERNQITYNHASSQGTDGDGGGIYALYGAPEIRHNVITHNRAGNDLAWADGGGIVAVYSTPVIRQNVIAHNEARRRGGGVFCEHSEATIVDNEVYQNTAHITYAGGIMSRNCSSAIERNVIYGNYGGNYGGGIFY